MSDKEYQEKAAEDIFPPKNNGLLNLSKSDTPLDIPRIKWPEMPSLDLDNLHANVEVYLNEFHKTVDEIFMAHGSSLLDSVSKKGFAPATRVTRTDKEDIIEIEVPGLDKGDISVTITEDKLIVEGEKKSAYESEVSSGVQYGKFYREFPLDGVDTELASSSLDKGILRVTIPLKEREGPAARKLEIK